MIGMNRASFIQLLLASFIFAGVSLYILPNMKITPTRLILVYFTAGLDAYELSHFLAGSHKITSLIIAGGATLFAILFIPSISV